MKSPYNFIEQFTLPVFFCIIGIGLLAGSLFIFGNTQELIKKSNSTTGVVIELIQERSIRGGSKYHPLISFETQKGESIQFTLPYGSSPPEYRVGENVTVLYDPNNPYNARIYTFFGLWQDVIFSFGIGALFFGIGLANIIRRMKKEKNWELFALERGLKYGISSNSFHNLSGKYRGHCIEIYVIWVRTTKWDEPNTVYNVEFRNPRRVWMTLRREGIIDKITKKLGAEWDIQIGDLEFDRMYLIKGSRNSDIKEILDTEICKKIIGLKNFDLTIDKERQELAHCTERDFIKEKSRLQSVLDVMIDIIEKIEKMKGI